MLYVQFTNLTASTVMLKYVTSLHKWHAVWFLSQLDILISACPALSRHLETDGSFDLGSWICSQMEFYICQRFPGFLRAESECKCSNEVLENGYFTDTVLQHQIFMLLAWFYSSCFILSRKWFSGIVLFHFSLLRDSRTLATQMHLHETKKLMKKPQEDFQHWQS